MLREHARLVVTVVGLSSLGLALSACSTLPSTVIRVGDDETIVISAQEECDFVLDDIEVRYALDDVAYEDMPLVWTAALEHGEGSRQVRLFEPNAGYEVHQVASEFDPSRNVIVGWSKAYPDGTLTEDALGGVLSELDEDNLIWFGGLTSVADYDLQRAIPWNSWDC